MEIFFILFTGIFPSNPFTVAKNSPKSGASLLSPLTNDPRSFQPKTKDFNPPSVSIPFWHLINKFKPVVIAVICSLLGGLLNAPPSL